jgi:hypothetical protein
MTGVVILSIFLRFLTKYFGGYKHRADDLPEHWSKKIGLRVYKGENTMRYVDRFSANTGKTFFNAERMIESNEGTFFAEGQINGRQIWVYRLTGTPPPGSGLGTLRNRQTTRSRDTVLGWFTDNNSVTVTERIFYGWGMEIETKTIPQTVTVAKKFIKHEDVLDIESAAFERKYDISNTQDSQVLQLLDPVLLQYVQESQCAAIEISDSSVLLLFTLSEIPLETLDAMLQAGLKIAEQVDRNFPLASYKK